MVENIFNLEPDKTLEIIRKNIYQIAERTTPNIYEKKIKVGDLPDSFPLIMRKKALKLRQDKSNFKSIMLYPTKVWRHCIFPNFKLNYVNYCHQNQSQNSNTYKINCKYLFKT